MKKYILVASFLFSSLGFSQSAIADVTCSSPDSDYVVIAVKNKVTLQIDGKSYKAYSESGKYIVRATGGQKYVITFEEQNANLTASVRFLGWGAPTSPDILACQ